MTSTKLIIAALMVPVVTLTALVMAAAAVAHRLSTRTLGHQRPCSEQGGSGNDHQH
jgi:hypothetical protein